MNSNDWQDIDNVRNQAIAQLAEICAAMGLSWSAGSKEFVISLPNIVVAKNSVVVNMDGYVNPRPALRETNRKTFDISTWGPDSGIVEGMQFPDYGEILDEGVPPQGDKDAEK